MREAIKQTRSVVWKKLLPLFLLVTIIAQGIIFEPSPALAYELLTPVEKYGSIMIADYDHDGDPLTSPRRQLCDNNGNPIQLKGMSSFGLQWNDGSWVLNDDAFDALAYDWKCDVVRLAMYVAEDGYEENPKTMLERVEKGIQLACDRGMYVIVDWHVLTDGNPLDGIYMNAGIELDEFADIKNEHPEYSGPQLFFAYLSQKYGDRQNIIWETANEPNGLGSYDNASTTWKERLLPYHQSIVDAIRTYDKDDVDNIIICGTDNWSQFVDAPIDNPVVDDNNQIMYTMHFYAGTHDVTPNEEGKYWLGSMIEHALDNGLAVFCTEWGTSEASGDVGPFINYSERWLNYLETQKISWCSWSLAKNNEISAAMCSTTPSNPTDHNGDGYPDWTKDELSTTGNYVRAKIRGEAAPTYYASAMAENFEYGIGSVVLDEDSPNQNLTFEEADIFGTRGLKVKGISSDGIWDNRFGLNDLDITYGIYQTLVFDIYFPKTIDVSNQNATAISIKPIIQSSATDWWGDEILEQSYLIENLEEEEKYYKLHCNYPLSSLDSSEGDKLGNILFLISLDTSTEGSEICFDNVGFELIHNGDISAPPIYIAAYEMKKELVAAIASTDVAIKEASLSNLANLDDNVFELLGQITDQELSQLITGYLESIPVPTERGEIAATRMKVNLIDRVTSKMSGNNTFTKLTQIKDTMEQLENGNPNSDPNPNPKPSTTSVGNDNSSNVVSVDYSNTTDHQGVADLTGIVTAKNADGLYIDKNGKKITNAVIETKWQHTLILDAEGKMVKNQFVETINGDTYFVNSKGYVIKNKKFKYENNDYFALKDGKIAKDALVTTPRGNLCYAQADGVIAKSQMIQLQNGKEYYASSTGAICINRFFTNDLGEKYYASLTGVIYKNCIFKVPSGKKYFATDSGKIAVSMLITKANGDRYYATKSGELAKSTWIKADGKEYYCNKYSKIVKEKY